MVENSNGRFHKKSLIGDTHGHGFRKLLPQDINFQTRYATRLYKLIIPNLFHKLTVNHKLERNFRSTL